MFSEPQDEHRWLERMVGQWRFESECDMGADQPSKFEGTDSVRSLGGLWIICESLGEMPGGGIAKNIITLGFDPRIGRFVGTFVGSVMANLWVYEGSLDETGNMVILDAEGPSFTQDGGLSKYQDSMELVDDDHRILRSQVLTPEGNWHHFMTSHYYRTK